MQTYCIGRDVKPVSGSGSVGGGCPLQVVGRRQVILERLHGTTRASPW